MPSQMAAFSILFVTEILIIICIPVTSMVIAFMARMVEVSYRCPSPQH